MPLHERDCLGIVGLIESHLVILRIVKDESRSVEFHDEPAELQCKTITRRRPATWTSEQHYAVPRLPPRAL